MLNSPRLKHAAIGTAALLAGIATSAPARDLEQILKDKGVITPQEATESERADSGKATTASAAPALPGWVGALTPYGDVRIRNELFLRKGDPDRNRDRFRLRFGAKVKATDEIEIGFKLVSGTASDPISNNVTFADTFTFKNINIGNGYVKLTPAKSIGLDRPWLTLTAGKFDLPFYSPTELVFDSDLTPEGFAEALKAVESKDGFLRGLTLNLGQWILQENNSTGEAAIYAFQGVGNFAIGDVLWNLGVADYKYVKASTIAVARNKNTSLNISNNVTLSDGTVVGGRTIDPTKFGPKKDGIAAPTIDKDGKEVAGKPITITRFNSEFNDVDFATDLTVPTGLKQFPVKLFFDYVKNTEASSGDDQGFHGGATIGAKKDAGDAWFTYAYQRLETDAVVSAFAGSDFGHDGGTNTKAHILQIGYVLTSNLSTLSTVYIDKPADSVKGRSNETDYRWQVDLLAKF